MSDVENLARLRMAAITGYLASDLAWWAVELCSRSVTAAERRAARDQLLRAAAKVQGESDLACANFIYRQLEHFRLNPSAAHICAKLPGTALGLIAQAYSIDRKFPSSLRQALRVVQGSDIPPP